LAVSVARSSRGSCSGDDDELTDESAPTSASLACGQVKASSRGKPSFDYRRQLALVLWQSESVDTFK